MIRIRSSGTLENRIVWCLLILGIENLPDNIDTVTSGLLLSSFSNALHTWVRTTSLMWWRQANHSKKKRPNIPWSTMYEAVLQPVFALVVSNLVIHGQTQFCWFCPESCVGVLVPYILNSSYDWNLGGIILIDSVIMYFVHWQTGLFHTFY